jgi:hypothetical protein
MRVSGVPVGPSRMNTEYAEAITSIHPSSSRSATAGEEYHSVSHHEA